MSTLIRPADTPNTLYDLGELIAAYSDEQGWGDDPFHHAEIEALPGEYAAPTGAAFVAYDDGVPVGCVVLRGLSADEYGPGIAEMRRLYVVPSARRGGFARALVRAIDQRARELGHERVRLVSLGRMEAAHALYRSEGFVDIAPYRPTTAPEPVFMEKVL